MDGINGIAAIEAIISGMTLMALSARSGDLEGAVVAATLAAASAGFLPWNFPKASVFMGDVASGTLGYIFAALCLRYSARGGSFVAAALPLTPFVFDTSVTLVRRIVKREPFWRPHRSHYYQRLTSLGWTQTAVSLAWAGLALVSSVVALQFEKWRWSRSVCAVVVLIIVHGGVAVAIAREERRCARVPVATPAANDRDHPA
jgi:UDP-N-acetylmuramyl pentapeptide phosphotransferase/UDP-N-acetylglucosamine-1-phosphate transferase